MDDRLVIDEHGTVRPADRYEGNLEEGLARYKAMCEAATGTGWRIRCGKKSVLWMSSQTLRGGSRRLRILGWAGMRQHWLIRPPPPPAPPFQGGGGGAVVPAAG